MITIEPIGYVESSRTRVDDDLWGDIISRIRLVDSVPADALDGLETFSHAEILFHFDRVRAEAVEYGSRHPRGNRDWPRVGIFAQRAKDRPNRLGSTIVRILGFEDRVLTVAALDAIDGTPVVDIKPVMREFLPREPVRQPAWCEALMERYWRAAGPGPSGGGARGVRPMLIAVAGPYSAPTADARQANLDAMNRAAAEVMRRGHIPVIGVNAALGVVGALDPKDPYAAIMTISLGVVGRCDAILMIGSSPGADKERDLIRSKGLPVYESIDDLPRAEASPDLE